MIGVGKGAAVMERRDWTLLAIGFAGGEPVSPVQLQKSLFLLGRQFPDEVGPSFHQFIPYHYGPYAITIRDDVNALASDGLVSFCPQAGRSWSEYAATPKGLERAATVKHSVDRRPVSYLEAVMKWARSLSFERLVSAIYNVYPDQQVNSVFQSRDPRP
jgi:uncharacterized protein YwgA